MTNAIKIVNLIDNKHKDNLKSEISCVTKLYNFQVVNELSEVVTLSSFLGGIKNETFHKYEYTLRKDKW